MTRFTDTDTFRRWMQGQLRRVYYTFGARGRVKREARVSRGKYECASCGGVFGPKEIDIDHIDPVIDPVEGFVDWNTYIERLFVEEEGLQALCKPCHQEKTVEENRVRRDKTT